jgi:hypothetical protein
MASIRRMHVTRTAEDQALLDALSQRAEQAEARVLEQERTLVRLRHDLRGILSPALLLADRLSASEDPLARRTANAMILTIERAEQALVTKS